MATRHTTSQLRRLWSPACPTGDMRTVTMWTGAKIVVHRLMVDAFEAVDAVMYRHRYRPRAPVTGAYNCRRITGGTGYSLHAYGIAADFNWDTNPYRSDGVLVTDMPAVMVADIKRISVADGTAVFRWGGDYRSVKDAMHFEGVLSPTDMRRGLDRGTYPAVEGDVNMEALVESLQTACNAAKIRDDDGNVLKVDGDLGAKTQQALNRWAALAKRDRVGVTQKAADARYLRKGATVDLDPA